MARAPHDMRAMRSGMGQRVSMARTRRAEMRPMMHKVRRSPRQDAMGGVMLSIWKGKEERERG